MINIQQTVKNIKNLKIQGASAIALASLNCLKNQLPAGETKLNKNLINHLKLAIDRLISARPTEPLTYNLLKFLRRKMDQRQTAVELNKAVNQLLDTVKKNDEKIIATGAKLVKNNLKVFTHCHSSAAEKILMAAKNQGRKFSVYNTETRPLFQGRITARHLLENKIPVTMVADSAAGFLISETSGQDLMMDLAILGADAVLPDGSVINKIGSFGIGLACHQAKVPLYIAVNLLKYDADGIIPIEIREASEIWPNKPKMLNIINFAFDKIPAKFITGLITEFGIIKPSQVKSIVQTYIKQGLIAK